jgi:hypothetical protein
MWEWRLGARLALRILGTQTWNGEAGLDRGRAERLDLTSAAAPPPHRQPALHAPHHPMCTPAAGNEVPNVRLGFATRRMTWVVADTILPVSTSSQVGWSPGPDVTRHVVHA